LAVAHAPGADNGDEQRKMTMDMTAWRRRVSEFGVEPGDNDEDRVRKNILTVSGFTAGLVLIAIGPAYLYFNEPNVGLSYSSFGLFVWAMLVWFGLGHKNYRLTVIILAAAALPAHWLTAVALGGFSRSHGIILWGLFFPVLGSLVFLGGRLVWLWFLLYAGGVAGTIFLEPWLVDVTNHVPPAAGRFLLAMSVITTGLFSLGIMLYFVNQRNRALKLLRREQDRSEGLLRNILPDDVAADLKEHGRTTARHYDQASILFADVVNFTPLSASLEPAALVALLNEVFSLFDALAGKYGLEKIKTIGDAYMVASGVPEIRPDHAEAITRMALEVRQAVESRTFAGRRLSLRLGINSGPVVAGVIGERKFSYDLWGDTVNTASRMESHGAANVIQVTDQTYQLIRHAFICEDGGHIVVKGKGEMQVWRVIGEK
jgi:guanylate cyclase